MLAARGALRTRGGTTSTRDDGDAERQAICADGTTRRRGADGDALLRQMNVGTTDRCRATAIAGDA